MAQDEEFKVIAYGESLYDLVKSRRNGDSEIKVPGGSPMNTAVALARQGVNVSIVTPVSNVDGLDIVEHLINSGVNTNLLFNTDLPTTLAFPEDDGKGGEKYKFEIEGHTQCVWTKEALAPREDGSKPNTGDFLTISGSLALGIDSMAEVFDMIFEKGSQYHPIFFDPNVREDLFETADDTLTAFKRFDRWVSCSTVVKLSDNDLEWRYPELSIEEAAEAVLEAGAKLVVVTLGDQGSKAFRYTQDGLTITNQIAHYVHCIDTIGAGDTYMAGIIKGLIDKGITGKESIADISEDDLKDAMYLAAVMSSITCSRQGANPPWDEKVKEALTARLSDQIGRQLEIKP